MTEVEEEQPRILRYPRRAVTTTDEGLIQIWDLETPNPDNPVLTFETSPTFDVLDTHLVFEDLSGNILMAYGNKIFSLGEKEVVEVRSLDLFESPLEFSYLDGRLLVGTHETLSLWDLNTMKLIRAWDTGAQTCLLLSPEHFIASDGKTLSAFESLELKGQYRTLKAVTSLERYENFLAVATLEGVIEIYDQRLTSVPLTILKMAGKGLTEPDQKAINKKRGELIRQYGYGSGEGKMALGEFKTRTLSSGPALIKYLGNDVFVMGTDFELVVRKEFYLQKRLRERKEREEGRVKNFGFGRTEELGGIDVIDQKPSSATSLGVEVTVLLAFGNELVMRNTAAGQNYVVYGVAPTRITHVTYLSHLKGADVALQENLYSLLPVGAVPKEISNIISGFI